MVRRQIARPVAGAVVAAALDLTRTHRQNRHGTLVGLDLRFLVHAQHQAAIRWVGAEPDHAAHLHEGRIAGKPEGPGAVRLQARCTPNPRRHRLAHADASRHGAGRPAGHADGLVIQGWGRSSPRPPPAAAPRCGERPSARPVDEPGSAAAIGIGHQRQRVLNRCTTARHTSSHGCHRFGTVEQPQLQCWFRPRSRLEDLGTVPRRQRLSFRLERGQGRSVRLRWRRCPSRDGSADCREEPFLPSRRA